MKKYIRGWRLVKNCSNSGKSLPLMIEISKETLTPSLRNAENAFRMKILIFIKKYSSNRANININTTAKGTTAKSQPRERTWQNQRGKKTLLSLTLYLMRMLKSYI